MRFAICISGELRTFGLTSWSLEDRLIRPTERGGAAVDLFFHVYSDSSALERAGEVSIRSLPGVRAAVVVPHAAWRNVTAATYGEALTGHVSSLHASFASQWSKVHLSFKLAFRYAPTPDYYAAFVRTRPDLIYLVPFNLAREHRLRSRQAAAGEYLLSLSCLLGEGFARPAVSDKFMMLTPAAAAQYARLPAAHELHSGVAGCCEEWLASRLQRMRVFEPPGRVTSPARECLRAPGQLTRPERTHLSRATARLSPADEDHPVRGCGHSTRGLADLPRGLAASL